MWTPEKLYEIWHREISLYKQCPFRRLKNFEKFQLSSKKIWFEKCVPFIVSSKVDPSMYFRSIIEYCNGTVFDFSILGSQKSVKIYRKYMEHFEISSDEVDLHIRNAFKFVVGYCVSQNYDNISKYMGEGQNLIPTVLLHLNAKNINWFFISLIPNMEVYIEGYPRDCVLSFLKINYKDKLYFYRNRVLTTKIGQNLAQGFDEYLDKALKITTLKSTTN